MTFSWLLLTLAIAKLDDIYEKSQNTAVEETEEPRKLFTPGNHQAIVEEAAKKIGSSPDIDIEVLKMGVSEPDDVACEGGAKDMAKHSVGNLGHGDYVHQMTSCRKLIQHYHGSPPPLVRKSQLEELNIDVPEQKFNFPKSWAYTEHYRTIYPEVFSVLSNKQWREKMVSTMALLFYHGLTANDLSEQNRILGNMFHLLTDLWSASHDNRKITKKCETTKIEIVVSMDITDWLAHYSADRFPDSFLWKCATKNVAESLKIWKNNHRKNGTDFDSKKVKRGLEKIIEDVLCISTALDDNLDDLPAGGAPHMFDNRFFNKNEIPKNILSEKSAAKVISKWREEMQKDGAGEDLKYPPEELFDFPERNSKDICTKSGMNAFIKKLMSENRKEQVLKGVLPAKTYYQLEREVNGCDDYPKSMHSEYCKKSNDFLLF